MTPHRIRWTYDAALCFAADTQSDEARGGGCARTGALSRSSLFHEAWIHGLPAEPDVIERERAHAELRKEDCSGCVKSVGNDGILARNSVSVGFGTVGGWNPGRVQGGSSGSAGDSRGAARDSGRRRSRRSAFAGPVWTRDRVAE